MIGLTAKQQAFYNASKANPTSSIAQLYYIVNHGSLEGYNTISDKDLKKYSQAGSQLKRSLSDKGIEIKTQQQKKGQAKHAFIKIEKEVKKLTDTIKEHGAIMDKGKVIERFVDNVNEIVDNTRFKKTDDMNKVEKEAFTDNSLLLYDMVESKQLKNIDTKEEQIKILTAMTHYSTSIERNLYGTEERGYTSKSYMRHPQIAFQCIKLICELTGTLQTNTNINIQVNNILQEIEQKRLKELTEDFNDNSK